jgi:predicted kinase
METPKIKPKCYQLIGLPGVGKTTWVKNYRKKVGSTFAYISTDKYIESYARKFKSTYNTVFEDVIGDALRVMVEEVVEARRKNKDIVWDQTSTTVQSRKKKFEMLPDYEHIAVCILKPDDEEHQRRLNSREGKIIPPRIISDMSEGFVFPSENEGFTKIWVVAPFHE